MVRNYEKFASILEGDRALAADFNCFYVPTGDQGVRRYPGGYIDASLTSVQ